MVGLILGIIAICISIVNLLFVIKKIFFPKKNKEKDEIGRKPRVVILEHGIVLEKKIARLAAIESGLLPIREDGWDCTKFNEFWSNYEKRLFAGICNEGNNDSGNGNKY